MKNSGWKIELDRSAQEALAYITRDDEEVGLELLARINKLKLNPYPNYRGGDYDITSYPIQNLLKRGYDIRTLKYSDIMKYRVFYFTDDDNELIIVGDIVKRDKETYDPKAPHIAKIKTLFSDHFKNKKR